MADGRRPLRVAEDVRDALSSVLGRDLSDPRLTGTVVTRVEVTPDLGVAHVFVRVLQEPTPRVIREVIKSLARAAGVFRRAIAQKLRTKRVPELRFFYDQAVDARARVDELLREIKDEESTREPSKEEDPKA
ncbi:MAG TPA: 30S ribosome-binding factor RbfA [Polyangiaceae bacterium]|jgi:ribosome-binding factor A|nr:30S ribosome-binding factor RbfA [Polyangiaceae bacterium]